MTQEELHQAFEELEKHLAEQSNFSETESKARALLSDSSLQTNAELHVGILVILSEVLSRNGSAQEAQQIAEQGLAHAKQVNSTMLMARSLYYLGFAHTTLCDYTKAEECYVQAQEMFRSLDSAIDSARCQLSIGGLYTRQSKFLQSLEYYESAASIFEEFGDSARLAHARASIGAMCFNIREYDKASESLEKARALFESLDQKPSLSHTLRLLGQTYIAQGKQSMAIDCLQTSLTLATELNDPLGVAESLNGLGLVHQRESDNNQALEAYGKALIIVEQHKKYELLAQILNNVGAVYRIIGDYEKAMEYFQRAMVLSAQIGNKYMLSIAYGSIGFVQSKRGEYTDALENLNRGLSISEEIDDKYSIAVHLGNIGEVYKNLFDYEKAREFYYRAISLADQTGNITSAAYDTCSLGALYADIQYEGYDAQKAEELLLKAISILTESSTKDSLDRCYRILADLYKAQGRWEEYGVSLEKHFAAKEDIQNEEVKKTAERLEQERNKVEHEKQLAVERGQAQATEHILHQVLPISIATRLIKGEKIADYFDRVSILFADIVGFTPISSRMPAKAVLAFLNYVFGEFDRMVTACGCEKIKTIGDGYLAVAGAPDSCDDHAERIARLAIEMSKDIILPEEIRKTLPKGAQFRLRIGIHTGPCFGGIVGENRFVYDIYSDAVNTAARMESHGEAGKIHVSDEFCFHLQNRMDSTGEDLGGIRFEERDEMEIKGKGMMRTYFLEKA